MKRANGTGTVVKLSGNRSRPYCVRISQRDKRGYVIQTAVSYHAKAAEAQAALDELVKKIQAGNHISADTINTTWGQAYEIWSARKYKVAGPASMASYKASWSRIGALADRKARSITIDDLQAIIDQDAADGMSSSSINNDCILIKALFKFLMERDIVAKDYSAFIQVPKVGPKHTKGAFDDFQMARLEKLAKEGFPWADTVLMLCYTGLRINEFLSLTPFNFDPDTGCLTGGSKTEAGKGRTVPVHPKIRPYFDRWMADQADTIIHQDGNPVSDRWYRASAFKGVMDALGVTGATPHWCRHTFVTRAKIAGVDEMALKFIVGHSQRGNITAPYTHPDPAWLATEMAKIA